MQILASVERSSLKAFWTNSINDKQVISVLQRNVKWVESRNEPTVIQIPFTVISFIFKEETNLRKQ
jgi:hypothetical protein